MKTQQIEAVAESIYLDETGYYKVSPLIRRGPKPIFSNLWPCNQEEYKQRARVAIEEWERVKDE